MISNPHFSRRNAIRTVGAGAVAGTALAGAPGVFTSHAADTSDYRALVCVFLFGGLDSHDVVIPYQPTEYDGWRSIRRSFVARQGASRDRGSLLPLARASRPPEELPQHALAPELAGIKALYDAGDAAVVANVGPLVEPVTRQTFEAGIARVPPRLFSHNDQQNIWQAGAPEGAQFGWGGLFADAVLASGGNGNQPQFTTITTEEVGPFLTGRTTSPFRIGTGGAPQINILEEFADQSKPAFVSAVREQLAARSFAGGHVIERDIAAKFASGLDSNDFYAQALASGVPNFAGFGPGPLSAQLRAVANTIAVRGQLSASRQIFFVGLGGFDTHSAQAVDLPNLLREIDTSVSAFHSAMAALGLSQQVTVFTASDFGRTLAVNGDGTDHGWGGHHFVVGGAVRGGEIYGDIPPATIDHAQEVGGGRLIPSLAVDQYAAQLGHWFGLTQSEIEAALPNLNRF
ncbi:MAG: DUF1501 domain-containing protein, partial [Pseudomonadota bacterium]